ncbi:hypothetical protein GCM10007036_20700 [Alsobacter metallidurans]|uniref:Phenylacetate-CoA ligase n=1 Tax=Alsobacter metallidurans TaxID=340221 RepID=A0A917I769_9HYPH|nr:hypothetical protein [Alsobacter metallidurans]GGH18472.1 hypothetical protein GCM10007036_20700 [Alsobacter metallidurans]
MLHVLRRSALFDRLARRPPVLYGRARRAIEAVEAMDAGQREDMQDRLLRRVQANARELAAYPAAETLAQLPVLEKSDMRGREAHYARRGVGAPAATGGTTGQPLRLRRSPGQIVFEQAMVDHLVALAGGVANRSVTLRGDVIKPVDETAPPFWRAVGPGRTLLSAHHLSRANYPAYAAFLERERPGVLHAYPSALDQLTRLAEEAGGGPPIGLVFTSSEQLPSGLRARVKRAFGADLLDFYGQAERVCAAWSLNDGEYWVRPDYGFVEFAAAEDGAHIVGTSLRNRAQILLRYDTGDLADLGPDTSAERLRLVRLGVAPFAGLTGRQSEYVELPDGTRIIGLNHVPRGVPGAASVQVLQVGPNRVRLHVTQAEGFCAATRAVALSNLRQKLPASVGVEWLVADAPFRLPNGKAPLFVDVRGRQIEPAQLISEPERHPAAA